jgi:hypothetical protein
MEQDAFKNIIRHYHPLAEVIDRISKSLREANRNAKLKVSFSVRLADPMFMEAVCRSIDGVDAILRSSDGKREARQSARLLAYDPQHDLLGIYQWPPGKPGTPARALRTGSIASQAADYIVIIHREWFRRGNMPPGIPHPDSVPSRILGAEVYVGIFGKAGVPSLWSPSA